MTKEEIKKLVLEQGLTITDLIDVVIEVNGYVGVGIITLGDNLNKYCVNKIREPWTNIRGLHPRMGG